MFAKIRNEPALAVALFQAALVVAVNFGWELTTQQMSAVVALAAAASALFVRQHVTPLPTNVDVDGSSGLEPGALQANPAAAPTPATVVETVEPAPTA